MPTTVATYTNIPGTLGGPLSFRRAGQSRFTLNDFQGHVRQLADAGGAVTDTFTPDAWGVQKASTGSTVNLFTAFGKWGYYNDNVDRLYVRNRTLKPSTGRWLSPDPLGHDRNRYGYADNAPTLKVDPNGLLSSIPDDKPNWHVGNAPPENQDPWQSRRCGAYRCRWILKLDKAGISDGYIVQRILWVGWLKDCNNISVTLPKTRYEAFFIPKSDDGTRDQSESVPSSGQADIYVLREAYYYYSTVAGLPPGRGWKQVGDPPYWVWVGPPDEPPVWGKNASGGEAYVSTIAHQVWCCCPPDGPPFKNERSHTGCFNHFPGFPYP